MKRFDSRTVNRSGHRIYSLGDSCNAMYHLQSSMGAMHHVVFGFVH